MRWMTTRSVCSILAFLAVSSCHTAFADVLQGEFKFEKRAPSVALVYLPEDTSLSADVKTVVDQKDKQFTQKMFVTSKGANAIFKNSDGINHNIFANDKKAGVKFDVGLMNPGGSTVHKVEWDEKIVKCSCKIHPRMKTWIASISSKYYKVIEFQKGTTEFSFEMNGFPENFSQLKVWMPNYDPIELSLSKGESQDTALIKRGKTYGTLTLTRK